jgi:hypothetical protein
MILILLALVALRPVQAASFQRSIVTFTFDDARSGQKVLAADILKQAGFKATAFISPTTLTGTRDTMTKRDVTDLQNVYGWEIGSRGMSGSLATCITSDCYNAEINGSKQNMTAMGLAVSTFAYPTGKQLSSNSNIRGVIEANYVGARESSSGKGTGPILETAGVDIYRVVPNDVKGNTTVDTVRGWIDQAVSSKAWLVLGFKQIVAQPSSKGSNNGQYLSSDLTTLAQYVKSKIQGGTLDALTFMGALDVVNGLRGTTGGTGGGPGGNSNGLFGLLALPLLIVGVAIVSGIGLGIRRFNSKKRTKRVYPASTPPG